VQFVHPDIDRFAAPPRDGAEPVVDWGRMVHSGGLVPLYPTTQELSRVGFDSAGFRRVLHAATSQYLANLTESLPRWIVETRRLPALKDAIRNVHFPARLEQLQDALLRLKYEELFRFQIKLALKRKRLREETPGISFAVKSGLARRLVDGLPFTLTGAQRKAIREITADMEAPHPMNRLLQGDVGSGKTVVALTAMLIAVDNGYQAVVMAPTEILAEQHFRTLVGLVSGLPVSVRLLTGGRRGALRRDILEAVREGGAQVIVGTHALFEKQVAFARLGLVVIDEQHRFGVMQRAALRRKGENADVLVMTATPIPRTLSLTLYGDLDVSVIDELPRGRKPVRTVVEDESARKAVYDTVRREVLRGRQAYFVYPLIEESEKIALRAATVHYEELRTRAFPDLRLGLLHGRMTPDEKDETMGRFLQGELDILVATTVIEVGIDVPNASLMVIENAERFGLSQLHQLRGRVGRGSDQAMCILLTHRAAAAGARRAGAGRLPMPSLDEQRASEQRLAVMTSTNDGFVIAEADLRLRGPGDFFGTRQSGAPLFRVADPIADVALLNDARSDAFALADRDPRLAADEHRALAADLRATWDDDVAIAEVG
jgi:ATP-dependent DNA helicase RecG